MIETRLLYYFLAVARERNITKAAKSLHVTQPTLSKQMMDLEDRLGCKLFERGKKGLTLTQEGTYLQSKANDILNMISNVENTFGSGDQILSGDINIACGETAVMEIILEIFKDFQKENPDVKLHIFSGNADSVLERLDNGLADIGLLLGPKRYDRYEYLEIPDKDKYGLLMSSKNPLAKQENINIEQLSSEPLILSEQLFTKNEEISFFGGDYSNLNVVATYNLINNATYLAEKEVGSILCLEGLVNTTGRDLVFRPINPELLINVSVVTKKYQNFSPAVKAFLQLINDYCNENGNQNELKKCELENEYE